jgi:prepilin-type processing-associated H-X9-DG protein
VRRTLRLAALAGAAVWLARRLRPRAAGSPGRVTVGFADGSATVLAEDAPGREGLLAVAESAL